MPAIMHAALFQRKNEAVARFGIINASGDLSSMYMK